MIGLDCYPEQSFIETQKNNVSGSWKCDVYRLSRQAVNKHYI